MIYAPEGSPAFQMEFGEAMAELGEATQAALGSNLVALVLGGGYGRGEGGIVHAGGADHAFNDVDLFLFVNDPASVDTSRLHSIERSYSEKIHAEVEFGPATVVESLSRMRPAQMWFDLIHGHVVIAGDQSVMDRFDPQVASTVPAYEASRLLLNRGAGLLWARVASCGAWQFPDPDFVRRNVWKANLALRDAALILDGSYPETWRTRTDAYNKWFDKARPSSTLLQKAAVARAAKFKLEPGDFPEIESIEASVGQWVEAFLELESIRFGTSLSDPTAYEKFPSLREPAGDIKDRLRNLARNLKGRSFSLVERRNRLYPELPVLLAGIADTEWRARAEGWLNRWKAWC